MLNLSHAQSWPIQSNPNGSEWIGLDWIGLDWIGLDWIGLDWIGLGQRLVDPFRIKTQMGRPKSVN